MVYRDKPQRNVTVLKGVGINQDTQSPYWEGGSPSEAASTSSSWTSHTQVPVLDTKNDPRGVFTPVAGGIQINFPGTYTLEISGNITGGAVGAREGFFFYTTGGIVPLVAAAGTPMGGELLYTSAIGSARWHRAQITVTVTAPGAVVKFQDYVQTSTSHTAILTRIRITKIVQGGPGPQGIQGIQGNTGPKGTRWGYTHIWAFGDSTDIACTMYDGGPPVVGDLLISLNGFSVGEVYTVTAVYPGTNNVDVSAYSPALNLKGPRGNAWGTVNVDFPGGAGAQMTGVTITMSDGSLPQPGDMVQNLHSGYPGDVYLVKSTTYGTTTGVIEKYTPVVNIRGPVGPAGDALSHWPVDSVYISFANVNPATYFGGTWVSVGSGKMLIGVDPADTTMDAAGETGGSKTKVISSANLPPHAHTINHDHADATSTGSGHTHTFGINYLATTTTSGTALRVTDVGNQTGGTGTGATVTTSTTGSGHTHNIPSYSGNSGNGPGTSTPMDIMPPFMAVYMWRRTA